MELGKFGTYTFINDLKEIEKELKSGKRLYPAGSAAWIPRWC